MRKILESITGKTLENKKSKTATRLDFLQSATGVLLIMFMIVHTFLVSSILLGPKLMYKVTVFFEGKLFFKDSHPVIVTVIGIIVIIIIMLHAWIALRKFPQNSREYKTYRAQMKMMNHSDTNKWFYQVMTGFFIFFFVLVHIFIVASRPETIGPNLSSHRVYSGYWIIYGILLVITEVHMLIGFYKLCLKWGWFDGTKPKRTRKILKGLYYCFEVFLLILGIATLVAYYRIGSGLEKNGMSQTKYVPTEISKKNY